MKVFAGIPTQSSPRTFTLDKHSQSTDIEGIKADLEFNSKLPAITDLINLKNK